MDVAQSRLKLSRQSRFDPSTNEVKRMVCFCIVMAGVRVGWKGGSNRIGKWTYSMRGLSESSIASCQPK